MPRDDNDYLRQMLEAAQTCLFFAEGRTRADLDNDLMLFYAVVKAVELIGEAASHVTWDVRARNPLIEWGQIIGMRNRLTHVFHDINRDILWNAVQYRVPVLIPQLEAALRQQPA